MNNRYFKEIDGLRFFVFLLILSNHIGLSTYAHGHTFFFALSGFLIGHTSFKSLEEKGSFSLKKYLWRRVLRTFPVYYFVVLICGIFYLIFGLFNKEFAIDNYWSYYLFLQNFYHGDTIFILKNLWAMAVTEQLYLSWGFLVALIQKKIYKFILPLCLLFIVIGVLVEYALSYVYENTLVYSGVYLMGVLVGAIGYRRSTISKWFFINDKKTAYIVCFLAILFFAIASFISSFVLREHIITVGFLFLIVMICYTPIRLSFILSNDRVRYLGKISYGLYCYHAIVITLMTKYFISDKVHLEPLFQALVVLLLSIFVSVVSYELFEKRFLRLKNNI